MKANRVEEDIEKASKVGKQVKWQVLDIRFGKQAKKNLKLKSLIFSSCLPGFRMVFVKARSFQSLSTTFQKLLQIQNLQEAALGLKQKAGEVSREAMLMTQIGLELLGRFEEEKERHIQKTQKELLRILTSSSSRSSEVDHLSYLCPITYRDFEGCSQHQGFLQDFSSKPAGSFDKQTSTGREGQKVRAGIG